MPVMPAPGYVSDNARTEQEIKDLLEDMIVGHSLSWRGGVTQTEDVTIASGTATADEGAYVRLFGQGDADDDLTDLSITAAYQNTWRVVTITVGDTNTITVKHTAPGGTDTITTWDQQDVVMGANSGWLELHLMWFVTYWIEIGRTPTGNQAGDIGPALLRSRLALGDASTKTVGSGNGLDADTVDTKHASDFLLSAGTAADSTLFDGEVLGSFVRNDTTGSQNLESSLKVGTEGSGTSLTVTHKDGSGTATAMNFMEYIAAAEKQKAKLSHIHASDQFELTHFGDDGTTIESQIQLPDGNIRWKDPTGTYEVWTSKDFANAFDLSDTGLQTALGEVEIAGDYLLIDPNGLGTSELRMTDGTFGHDKRVTMKFNGSTQKFEIEVLADDEVTIETGIQFELQGAVRRIEFHSDASELEVGIVGGPMFVKNNSVPANGMIRVNGSNCEIRSGNVWRVIT